MSRSQCFDRPRTLSGPLPRNGRYPAFAADLAPLVLRLVAGVGFLAHGYAKLSRGPDTFAVVLQTLGVPAPHLMSWLTTLVEVLGGFALVVGAFVPIVCAPLAIVLVTALVTVHWRYGFFSVKLAEVGASGVRFGTVGYEIILLYLACLAALVLGGAGAYSVDAWLAMRRTSHRPGMAVRRVPRSADVIDAS